MVTFPNVKINLGLNILSKREDGYHNLQSIFYPVDWCDILEIVKADCFHFEMTGLEIPGESKDNLVVKAYELMKSRHKLGPVSIHLHKTIPTGAGLGAGSSNGVFALKMLNEIFDLNLDKTTLLKYAAELGSDCSFFIENIPCHVSGRGENLEKIDFSLSKYWIKIIHPGLHISTKEAFSKIVPKSDVINLKSITELTGSDFSKHFINDFEESLKGSYPQLQQLKQDLLSEGAIYASMSGSGSAIYGLFENEPKPKVGAKFEFIGKLK
ncbi:MAG: 4-(cytidine 5'-diphospho)-2-C-methyl-D-erythritol kinase [Crocinitomicaceae bacterium]|nr:4-(cytidine 5'-diphospho)-2-C-methyl-D-erythritol kinase [Crocinitomicaceae bacterium]